MTFTSGPKLWSIEKVTFCGHRIAIRRSNDRTHRKWTLRGIAIIDETGDPHISLCRNPARKPPCLEITLHTPRNSSGRLEKLRRALEP